MAQRHRFDPIRMATWIRRITALCAVGLLIFVVTCFGTEWVPHGMDTVPSMPTGSWCVVDRRQSQLAVGDNVFVQVPGKGLLLSRIAELGPDTVTLRNPNDTSTVPDSRTLGALPRRAVKGIVRLALPPGAADRGIPRGR
ncbi:MAG: S24/S26 family peptidase [Planctomycetota bacterium]